MLSITIRKFISLSVFVLSISFGQASPTIDSLNNVLNSSKVDTVIIRTLNELSWEYAAQGNNEEAMVHAKKALALSEKINFIQGKAASLHAVGIAYRYMGKDSLAIEYYHKSLKINEDLGRESDAARQLANLAVSYSDLGNYKQAHFYNQKALKIGEKLGDKDRIATQMINSGTVYFQEGDYPNALDYFLKALRLYESLGDKKHILAVLANIGVVYKNQNNNTKALEYYFRSLKLSEEAGTPFDIAKNYSNIANIYKRQNELDKAEDYHFRSLRIYEKAANKKGMALQTGNIAIVYDEKGDHKKALDYYLRSQKIREELGNKSLMGSNLGNLGTLYVKLNQFNKAEECMKRSLSIAEEVGSISEMQTAHKNLFNLYEDIDQDGKALLHYKKYIDLRDSIYNADNTEKLVRSEMNFEFEKKQAIEQLEQEKKEAMAAEELKQQKIITYSSVGGGVLVLVLLMVSYRGYRQKQKANIEITHQKAIIEERNKEVHDSITYAKRIQTAILPPEKLIKQELSNSFVLFKPKDIVSGDFYWMESVGSKTFFSAVDCTGHGVPGAMVSVVGHSGLNRTVKEFGILQPSMILDKLTLLVEETFSKSESQVKDGMDISLCCIDKETNVLEWSGANNPLWLIRDGMLQEVKADKQPIGAFDHRKPYTNHTFQMGKGDCVYIFTDGYADQFGGEKGKKFKYKQLEQLLISLKDKEMEEQRNLLDKAFEEWKGSLEQIDDVCIFGVRF